MYYTHKMITSGLIPADEGEQILPKTWDNLRHEPRAMSKVVEWRNNNLITDWWLNPVKIWPFIYYEPKVQKHSLSDRKITHSFHLETTH